MAKAKKPAAKAGKIETHEIQNEAEWLARRKLDVTASGAPALLGVHDYVSAFELYQEKRGEAPDLEESAPMRRGRMLEPVAVRVLREENPEVVFTEPRVYLRDPAARLGATPDLYAEFPDGSFGIVQIKSVAEMVFNRKWKGESGLTEPPLWIVVQAIIEAHLASAALGKPVRAFVAPLVIGFGISCELIEIPLDNNAPRVVENIKKKTTEFWAMVEAGTPPEFDFAKDGEAIAALYGATTGTTIDLSRDNRAIAAHAELVELRAKIAADKKAEEALKAEITAKMGANEVAYIGEGRALTNKLQHRKGYTVEPTSFRVIRASFKGA